MIWLEASSKSGGPKPGSHSSPDSSCSGSLTVPRRVCALSSGFTLVRAASVSDSCHRVLSILRQYGAGFGLDPEHLEHVGREGSRAARSSRFDPADSAEVLAIVCRVGDVMDEKGSAEGLVGYEFWGR